MILKGPRALLLNGTVGVGKTTLAAAIAGLLTHRGVPNAYLDVDELRRKWPAPDHDPFNSAIAIANLASLTSNFVQVGVQRLVLAGVVESQGELAGYSSAVGMPLVMCRLRASADVLDTRLRARHVEDAHLTWHLARAPELDRILDAAHLEDHLIDVSTSTPVQAAGEVLDVIGWTS